MTLSQTLVRYNISAPTSSTLTGTVINIPFVMPCPYNVNGGACTASYAANSGYYMSYAGAADWRKWTGRGSSTLTISKKVASHRISDATILPTSSQPTFIAYTLGYYIFDPYQTEDFDFGSAGMPSKTNERNPGTIYDIANYTNCFASGPTLVSNCGKSITVPVSNTIKQTYYIAVGTVGKVNGTFRVHFSDSSVADYVVTDTNALTGTTTDSGTQNEQMFSLTMQSVSAGVTATISYIGANIDSSATSAGIGIISAAMGSTTNGVVDPRLLPQLILNGFGPGIYGSQVIVPNSSAINLTSLQSYPVAHNSDPAVDTASYQTALDYVASHPNGVGYNIILADGFTTSGTIVPHNPSNRDTGWIITTCAVLPTRQGIGGDVAYGTRVDKGDTTHCHIMGNPSNGSSAIANDNNNSSLAARQVHHYAWIGLEIGFVPTNGGAMYAVASISGTTDTGVDTNYNLLPANFPHHILFERCYIHGRIPAGGGLQDYGTIQGLGLNANYVGVYDSYFEGFNEHHSAGNTEAKAIAWNASAGPISIVNTHLEANTESVICCAQSQQTLGNSPTYNVYMGYNYSTKNRAEIGYASEKNHLEMKGVTGWTIEWTVLDNSWDEYQQAQCFALNSHGGVPVFNPLLGVANILIQHNYCETGNGMSLNTQEELGIGVPMPSNLYNMGSSIKIQDNWIKICASTAGGGSRGILNHHSAFGLGGLYMPNDLILHHNKYEYSPAHKTDSSVSAPKSWSIGPKYFSTYLANLPGQAARRATSFITNNVMQRPLGGDDRTAYYGFMPYGINFSGNDFDMPDRSGVGGGPLAMSGAAYDLGLSYFVALQNGNVRNIIGLGTNYVSGCLLSTFVGSNGTTCTSPPTITYPNPSRGADKPSIASKYCLIKWGNRSDLVTSKGCVNPTY